METFDLTGITQVTQDSRNIKPGALFIALRGEKTDATQFIPQAEAFGAVAVMVSKDAKIPDTRMRVIRVDDPRIALSQIAAQFYPNQPEHVVAVTGTDGKTSTSDFFRQLTQLCGKSSASIGTIGIIGANGKKIQEATHTTPGPIALHQMLNELAAKGISHLCMEASSHGLDQYRLHGVRLEAAAFTNLARDHMDYHKTEQDYFNAKARLFAQILPGGGVAVLNADDAKSAALRAICTERKQRIIDYGNTAEAMKINVLTPTPTGQELQCTINGKSHTISVPLVGAFQAMNILAAMGLASATGLEMEALIAQIPQLKGVPGRLELAATRDDGAPIFVDYAHTPAALANILRTLRTHTKGKLHLVFGCGGNRDAGKRTEMGKVAEELADKVIVTDDNPRNENPDIIRDAIIAGCPKALEIGDRVKAIYTAVHGLESGDILVIAGKGHEKYQIIGNVEHPHDDVLVAKQAVDKSH